ncbi:MAG: DUF4136 domain-containing protein, partial [Bacteroidales bacterium]|nr:DUF4136 domain-containing protein [Bacteroidales bacterium]
MKIKLLTFLSIALIFSACSTIKVTADRDGSVDFTQYKTYSYLGWSENSTKMLNDFDKRRFEAAFANEFEKRGMEYVLADGDVMISLFL